MKFPCIHSSFVFGLSTIPIVLAAPREQGRALYKRQDQNAWLNSTTAGPGPTPTIASVASVSTLGPSDSRKPPDATVTANRAAMTPYLYACDSGQKAKVSQAWNEAGMLADAHAKWKPPGWFTWGSYQSAMDMYLGTDSQYDDQAWFGIGPLKQNINRQQGIHTSDKKWSPYWSYAYIYCDESKVPAKPKKPEIGECSRPKNPEKSVLAYTFPDDGTIFGWNAKYVVLCPRFFEDDILTLQQQTNNAKQDKSIQEVMDPWRKVKARSLFHETYHWGPAEVSDPICNKKPELYLPKKVVSLANEENIGGSKTNAESWAQAAMACYVMQTFKLKKPPVPMSQASIAIQMAVGNISDDIEEKFFDTAPDWFDSPVRLDANAYAPSGAETLEVGGSDTIMVSPILSPSSTVLSSSDPTVGPTVSRSAAPSSDTSTLPSPQSDTATSSSPSDTSTSSSPPMTSVASPSPTSTPSVSSPECAACAAGLGAGNCSADDDQCLANQCKTDASCQACGTDCDQYANL